LVRMPPCHGGGRGFESRPDRKVKKKSVSIISEHFFHLREVSSRHLQAASNEVIVMQREKLFDGFEEDIAHQSFEMSNGSITYIIQFSDIIHAPLKDLSAKISRSCFDRLLQHFSLQGKTSLLGEYKSEESLTIYYVIRDDTVILFSFGEYQPARYMLYLEGFWTDDEA
jgi:hypothetical protein